MRIVDGHAHVASMRFIPTEFVTGVARNIAAQAVNSPSKRLSVEQIQSVLIAQHQDHYADELVRDMDAAGIAMTVLLAPDFSHALRCSLSVAEMAAEHHKIRQRHPGRFYVFQGIDPRSGREGVELFERAIVEYGFNGLKLYPPCGYSPSDERLFPAYEICARRGLPVLLHTGPTSPVLDFNFAHPSLIDRAAREFPGVSFILAHGAVHHTRTAVELCAYRPNVYLDISAFPGILHPLGWQQQLKDLFRLGINHKIIFGTDWPLFRMTAGTRSCLEELMADGGPFTGVPAREIEVIMAGTIERLIPH